MACIKSVVEANDAQLIAVHKEFSKWKKDSSFARITSDYCLALRHFSKKGRSITKYCGTFNSKQSYARSIVTTQVIDGKVYWQLRDNIGWKQAHVRSRQHQEHFSTLPTIEHFIENGNTHDDINIDVDAGVQV